MRSINVWAWHYGDLQPVCQKAGIEDKSISYPAGDGTGQAGWDVAVSFASLKDLADQLNAGIPMPRESCGHWIKDCWPITRGEINRLAIMAHGDRTGESWVNGQDHPPSLNSKSVDQFQSELAQIGLYTREMDSTIIMMGCMAGQGDAGTKLLCELSRIWPHRKVVGFSTVGYSQIAWPKACKAPGMRDTDAVDAIFANPRELGKLWGDFVKMPWASEESRHAKVVVDGVVRKWPEGEMLLPGSVERKTTTTPPKGGTRHLQHHR